MNTQVWVAFFTGLGIGSVITFQFSLFVVWAVIKGRVSKTELEVLGK